MLRVALALSLPLLLHAYGISRPGEYGVVVADLLRFGANESLYVGMALIDRGPLIYPSYSLATLHDTGPGPV